MGIGYKKHVEKLERIRVREGFLSSHFLIIIIHLNSVLCMYVLNINKKS